MNYYELEPEDNKFYTLHAEITHRCNMVCENCYLPNRDIGDLPFDDLIAFVKRLKARTDIRLIGAEPTLYRELPELISEIRKLGHRTTLITNGLKLADLEYAKQLKDAGLRRLSISMNGVDCESSYKKMENGPSGFANKKVEALKNCMALNFAVSPQMIVVRGINDHLIGRLPELVEEIAESVGRGFGENDFPIICRYKSVGQIGRYMEGVSMSLDELAELVSSHLDIGIDEILKQNTVNNFEEPGIRLFPYGTSRGNIFIKVTSWSVNEEGVTDPGSQRRGRITQNWKVAPCFEHIKKNEFGF